MQLDHPTTNMGGHTSRPVEQYSTEEEERQDTSGPRTATDILTDSQELYEKKNDDYGDSWKLTGATLSLWCQHQEIDKLTIPTTPEHLISFGLFTRRLDKMIREFNGWFMLERGDDLRVDESTAETHEDDVPYAAMHTQVAEEYASKDVEELLP